MPSTSYTVTGMSCGHCAQAIREEVGKLDGVTEIAIDVAGGVLTIDSAAPIPTAAVVAAVDEAGYTATAR